MSCLHQKYKHVLESFTEAPLVQILVQNKVLLRRPSTYNIRKCLTVWHYTSKGIIYASCFKILYLNPNIFRGFFSLLTDTFGVRT